MEIGTFENTWVSSFKHVNEMINQSILDIVENCDAICVKQWKAKSILCKVKISDFSNALYMSNGSTALIE